MSFAYSMSSDPNKLDVMGIPSIYTFWRSFYYKGNAVGIVNDHNYTVTLRMI